VLKGTEAVAKAECELQAKENMLFAGTAISNGICIGMVTSIGMDTEIGKIQSQIQVGTWHMHVCTCMHACVCICAYVRTIRKNNRSQGLSLINMSMLQKKKCARQ